MKIYTNEGQLGQMGGKVQWGEGKRQEKIKDVKGKLRNYKDCYWRLIGIIFVEG